MHGQKDIKTLLSADLRNADSVSLGQFITLAKAQEEMLKLSSGKVNTKQRMIRGAGGKMKPMRRATSIII